MVTTEGKRVKTNLTVTVWQNCYVGCELFPLPPLQQVYLESEIKSINFTKKIINKRFTLAGGGSLSLQADARDRLGAVEILSPLNIDWTTDKQNKSLLIDLN